MKQGSPVARYREDYKTPDFNINHVDLVIHLHETRTKVISTLQIERRTPKVALCLDGEKLSLVRVKLDGQLLAKGTDFEVTDSQLIFHDFPEQATLEITNTINPSANTAFEGLYKSGGAYCTQCEAEGFRRITYFLDRPDVLSHYTTTIFAEKEHFPFLLANGNPIDSGEIEHGIHWVKWHDPFPKPCYLFALVAGDFDLLEDAFTTQTGREVKLQVFVDKGNLEKSQFAMASLKHAMAWDEERFNLTYDLDIYMIVAVDFFNMGAMENKGLNIFNSKYVLANPSSATDQDFLNIESVIGHEYFHNWTGNRITCRDWFQLSLKEGLTVFRDQEFSADRGMREVNRIQDARIMRTHQFDEDASPMAHPIRPDQVMEMNNFYTVTVYNKGAEVIRMLHTLLEEEGFQRGMQLYVERHDGQAVTCEDFVRAMEDANQRDLFQFRRWYSQAGTPRVSVVTDYNAESKSLTLTLTQSTPATPAQAEKLPFLIPLKAELFDSTGRVIKPKEWPENDVLELTSSVNTFELSNIPEDFIFAPLANFSAPIRVSYNTEMNRLIAIAAHARDAFLRWDAVQQIYLQLINAHVKDSQPIVLTPNLIVLFKGILSEYAKAPAMAALLLELPSEEAISSEYETIPVTRIHQALKALKKSLYEALYEDFLSTWKQLNKSPEAFNSEAISQRMLANVLLNFLAFSDSKNATECIEHQFAMQENMTCYLGALQASVHNEHALSDDLLCKFRERWQHNSLVMDKWFAVQASIPSREAITRVKELMSDPLFNWNLPNRVYALFATFSHNLAQLHEENGDGYALMFTAIRKLNQSNPQVASRLISPLLKWKRLEPAQGKRLKLALESLQQEEQLSNDLYEKVSKSLSEES